ncbi:MAG: DNA-binding protein [Caulobacteraceae bacterium]|nr:DNA-binding protein [Caulobacteraceae bacterium]
MTSCSGCVTGTLWTSGKPPTASKSLKRRSNGCGRRLWSRSSSTLTIQQSHARHWRGGVSNTALTPADLATRWACSKRHVVNLIRRGQLTAFRVGRLVRVRPEEVNRYECATASPSINEGSSPSSIETTAPDIELRLNRLIGLRQRQKPQTSSGG